MKLMEYLKGNGLKELAQKVGSTPGYIERVARGWQRPGPVMAIRIEEATGGQVARSDLRPDLWPIT